MNWTNAEVLSSCFLAYSPLSFVFQGPWVQWNSSQITVALIFPHKELEQGTGPLSDTKALVGEDKWFVLKDFPFPT